MRAAVLKEDVVVNVIEYEEDKEYSSEPGTNLVVLSEDSLVSPGWCLINGEFVAPQPEVEAQDPEVIADEAFRSAVGAATNLQELKAALLGSKGPGAQPRTGRPD